MPQLLPAFFESPTSGNSWLDLVRIFAPIIGTLLGLFFGFWIDPVRRLWERKREEKRARTHIYRELAEFYYWLDFERTWRVRRGSTWDVQAHVINHLNTFAFDYYFDRERPLLFELSDYAGLLSVREALHDASERIKQSPRQPTIHIMLDKMHKKFSDVLDAKRIDRKFLSDHVDAYSKGLGTDAANYLFPERK